VERAQHPGVVVGGGAAGSRGSTGGYAGWSSS
jgi:hypothetical protein